MYGLFSASKKSLLFNFPSFMPLPVSTLAASALISKTPVLTSVEVNVMVASHLSNLPAMATEAFTLKPILLLVLSNLKTGTCAEASGARITARIGRIARYLIFISFPFGTGRIPGEEEAYQRTVPGVVVF